MGTDIIKIDLNDWTETGGGAVGKSYENKSNPDIILKMSNINAPLEDWKRELDNSKAFIRLGLPTPEPGFIAYDGKNYGLAYTRIHNKSSYARMVGQCTCTEEIDALAESFTKVAELVHSTNGKGSGLRNIKDFMEDEIESNVFHDALFKANARRILHSLPDGESVLHGDLHFGNVIRADGRDYLIDLGDAAYGYYKFDLAMPFNIVAGEDFGPEKVHIEMYHSTFEQSFRFQQRYIELHEHTDRTMSEMVQEMMPYLCMRIIVVENRLGMKLECPFAQRLHDFIRNA